MTLYMLGTCDECYFSGNCHADGDELLCCVCYADEQEGIRSQAAYDAEAAEARAEWTQRQRTKYEDKPENEYAAFAEKYDLD